MTLFEFVLRKYIGPPRGRSWSCPRHTDRTPSMRMQSSAASDKCRCKCYSCGFWGDVYDVLKIFHPLESFPELKLRVRDMENELTAMRGTDGSFSQGTPEAKHKSAVTVAAGNIWADFRDNDGFKVPSELIDRCKTARVSIDDVIEYDRAFHDWLAQSDQQHLDDCNDPECEASTCRSDRGLPPLTPDEIKCGREEREQAKLEQQARVRHALRSIRRD